MEMFLSCVNKQELLTIECQLQGESFKVVKDEPEVVLVYTPGAGIQLVARTMGFSTYSPPTHRLSTH